jgi:uncharacterized protein YfaS (alpha-2-macroglobulin family)
LLFLPNIKILKTVVMNNPMRWLPALICLLSFAGCDFSKRSDDETHYNPFVKSFTTGTVSRLAPVYLILNEDVAEELQSTTPLDKLLKIKPNVKGTFSFEDSHTVVFKPATALERNTEYKVSADLSKWFELEGQESRFNFKFSTYPLALHAALEAVNVNDDDSYDIVYTLHTPDTESPETVESLVGASEKTKMLWQHNPDERNHRLSLQGVEAREKSYELSLSVKPNRLGLKEDLLITTHVPGINEFMVYEVKFVSEPERYVEVVFSEKLDDTQPLQGLAYIVGNTNETVTVENNKLQLYPDNELTGTQQVFLSASLRSKKGKTLSQDHSESVDIINALPGVRFAGEGNIIPQTADLNVPFQAIYLRGVVVRIIRIFENNIGQFMQSNRLDGNYNLAQVGRLVARQTVFFDGDEQSFRNWKTYSIRLNEWIEPEPGAIYRIELSFTRELSAYPCEETVTLRSREQIQAEDELRFKEDQSKYDQGDYYYYYGETDYDYYEGYSEREDPCSNNYYYNNVTARNILATNLGLMTFGGEGNEMTTLVHNLLTTAPEKGVTISFYNYQHQLLGAAPTDEKGQAVVALSGKPYYLIASRGAERAYLRVDPGSALSLSSFDVAGEVVQKGLKGFIYGERGVWRPGDTLHLGFMLNDRLKNLPPNHPVVMELFNPLGQSYLRKTQTQGELGVYTFAMPTETDAPTGAWQVKVEVGGTSFSKRIRIETIKPNRLKINLSLPDKPVLKDALTTLPLHTEWLQGAVAAGLKYQLQANFTAISTTFPDFKDYTFDDPSKTFESEDDKLLSGTTDASGDALIETRFETASSAPGMLRASLVTRVYEESGEFSIDGSSLLYSPYKTYVGIKAPNASDEQLDTGKPHTFEVASVDYTGKPLASELIVDVYSLKRYWWWESSHAQLGRYISDSYLQNQKRQVIKTGANGRASFHLQMEQADWGSYFIRIKDKNSGHTTGLVSYFDWPGYTRNQGGGNDALSRLHIRTDKKEYAPGEKLLLSFPSVEGGRAIVVVANGSKTLAFSEHTCQANETSIPIDVTPEMQPNAYLYVAVLQAYGSTKNDLPLRMYGVTPVAVSSPASHLNPEISAPEEIKPESACRLTVSEKNGRPMAYTLAIVDEGLLDLTHFPTPDPWQAFNAREALGVASWDFYNYILGAYGGRIEQLFSIGGDDALIGASKTAVNRFKPVVHFEGPFLLKKGEKRQHTYQMPNYNGRVRLMLVAGDGEAYGHADKSVLVRKPIMLLATLPRVIGIGEEMRVPASVFATEEGVGRVKVSITCSPNMEIIGAATQELNFSRKEDKQAFFRIRVKDKPGAAKVNLTASGKGEQSTYETELEIRSVSRPQTQVVPLTIEAGKSWKNTLQLPGVDGSNTLALEVSTTPSINLGFRLAYLIGYPHGCIEQITSTAFPQLYLKEVATLSEKETKATESAVKEVIRRYRTYQLSNGGFSYWPYEGQSAANPWGTVYAAHFLWEAEAKGYLVPTSMKRNAMNYLQRSAREWASAKGSQSADRWDLRTQAYRLYVLALGNSPELGAMNRLKENKDFKGTAVWLLAAAYARAGREDVAAAMIDNTSVLFDDYIYDSYTYGSSFRDLGICLQTLCLLKREREATDIARKISDILSSDKWLSTQETAYALIGISGYMNRFRTEGSTSFSYTCAGESATVKTDKPIWTSTLLSQAAATAQVEVKNTGNTTLFVRLITSGTPPQDEVSAHAQDVSVEVKYVDGQGQPLEIDRLSQGTNFTALIRIKNNTHSRMENLALSQLIPSGWEILNTRYLNESEASPANSPLVSYQDIRDDRIYSYIDALASGTELNLRIKLAAVYAGRFYLPPIYCESMYNAQIQANTDGRYVEVTPPTP